MIKTNKSYTKRLKVTRNGKIVARKAGQNHFNTRESRNKHTNRRRTTILLVKNKDWSRFLANSSKMKKYISSASTASAPASK